MTMRPIIAALAAIIALCAAGSARAQATRTWVSGVGDDANSCARTQPCKTFAGALGKTAPGGEIDALDAGDFGQVTITKAITIDGRAALSASAAAGSDGITVMAGATDTVVLRALSLHGDGTHSGVVFSSGAALLVEDCAVAGFSDGIHFAPAAGGQLTLVRVASRDNSGAGLLVGAGGMPAAVTVSWGHFSGNGTGILANAGARVDVYDSVASGNRVAGVSAALDAAGGSAEINLQGVTLSQNGVGVNAAAVAGSAIVRMSQVLATGNATAPTQASGKGEVLSFGDNRLDVQATLALSSSAPSQTVRRGQPATFPVAVAVNGVLAAPIALSCSGLPAGAACRFSTATLPAGTENATLTLTVSTGGAAMGSTGAGTPWRGPLATGALFLLLALLWARRGVPRQARWTWRPARAFGAAAAIALLAGLYAGCKGTPPPPAADMAMMAPDMAGLAAGTYPFQVRAASGPTTASLPLTLIVQ